MEYTVDAVGITKSFGGQRVLSQVDLAVESGTVFALLGPNGAGKTTMVRILATLVRPDEGTALVAGHDVVNDPMGVKRSISLTGQFAAIDDLLTGEENLEMMAQLRRLSRRAARARATELLASFELTDARHRRAGTYSGGMRRRLDLAMGMIERPRLLFLDEPTTGLDPRSREQLWETVRQLVDEGVTVLLTTQYLEEADVLADGIALLDHGRIVARGSAEELKQRFGSEVIRLEFASGASFERAAAMLSSAHADGYRRTLDIATDGTAGHAYETLAQLVRCGTPATTMSIHRPSLDDVFLSLTGTPHSETESREVA
jgi:ABC-2 type transport system ATP-binding protein